MRSLHPRKSTKAAWVAALAAGGVAAGLTGWTSVRVLGAVVSEPNQAGPTSAAATNAVPAFAHIFVVLEENHSFSSIIGNTQAPYLNSLAARYGLAVSYSAVSHPSLPNYLALTGGSTYVTSDCDPSSCPVNAVNIADRIEASQRTWKGYMEEMPSPCTTADAGNYAVRHDPFVYFNDIRTKASRCDGHVVPYSTLGGDLASAATTPNFVWITPNLNNDMHDGSVAQGDAWASANFPAIFNSPAWTTQNSVLFVTWDEGDSDNQVATLAISPLVPPGTQSRAAYDHYSLLRTVEAAWGLPPLTANDGAASAMSDFFLTGFPSCVASDAQGYWLVASDGGTFPFGKACGFGSTGNIHLNQPVAGMAGTLDDRGYYLVAADGGIFPFGDAQQHSYGSTGGMHLNQPIVGMTVTASGNGYYLVAADGGIFPFGDAQQHSYGSTGGMRLNRPIVGMAAAPGGGGYWLVASDGGIFPFGPGAGGFGSTGGMHLNQPIVGMAATPDGQGYWLVASDGGIFPFGDAGGFGSTGGMHLNKPVVGMTGTPDGRGYWLAATDGGIFPFGDAGGYGSTGNLQLNKPIVGVAATH